MAEERRAQVSQHPLPHPTEQVALRHRGQVKSNEGGQQRQHDFIQGVQVASENRTVDGKLDQEGREQCQAGSGQHCDEGAQHMQGVGLYENEHIPDDAQVEGAAFYLVRVGVQCAARAARSQARCAD